MVLRGIDERRAAAKLGAPQLGLCRIQFVLGAVDRVFGRQTFERRVRRGEKPGRQAADAAIESRAVTVINRQDESPLFDVRA